MKQPAFVMILSLATLASGCRPAAKSNPKPMGKLGYPLGTTVTVEGVRCDRCPGFTQMLAVTNVDAKLLPQPVVLNLDNIRDLPGSVPVILKGFETGHSVRWNLGITNRFVLGLRTFEYYFVVTELISPKPWKPIYREDLWSESNPSATPTGNPPSAPQAPP